MNRILLLFHVFVLFLIFLSTRIEAGKLDQNRPSGSNKNVYDEIIEERNEIMDYRFWDTTGIRTKLMALRTAATWVQSDGASLFCENESSMFRPEEVSVKPVYRLTGKDKKKCKGSKCYGTIGSKIAAMKQPSWHGLGR
ncbi:DgyrCDS2476 [Dimorphilus gyrociliatus]|uniref:DgyrCDS2476 n=1 Tax=Dimorphilus gyrociliatus TaxID=2664684 RepID=A0A7I8VBQ4_9ANNE|nr:DgyrCDS2476 [Dimorphilus gyrociliatus]